MKKMLSDARPDLVLDWDYEKNTRSPENVYLTEDYLVSWKCHKCNHEWSTKLYKRTRNGGKCPNCNNGTKTIIKGKNDLKTLRPDILIDWDYENNDIHPSNLRVTSHYQVHWKCHKCNHKWVSRLDTRTANGSGCPMCNTGGGSSTADYLLYFLLKCVYNNADNVKYRQRVMGYECDVVLSDRKICIEYDGCAFHNNNNSKDEYKTRLWEENGYSVYRIKETESECLTCNIRDDVAYLPHIVESTFDFYKKSYVEILKWWGIIEENVKLPKEYIDISRMDILSIIHKPPYNRSVKHSLVSVTSMFWDYERNKINPENIYDSSTQKAYFKCEYNHVSYMRIDSITKYGYNCPYCSLSRLSFGINDVRETSYNIYMWIPELRNKLSLSKKYAGSGQVTFFCPFCQSKKLVSVQRITLPRSSTYCSCLRDVNIIITVLGEHKSYKYYCIKCYGVVYLIVTYVIDEYLQGYNKEIKKLDLSIFKKLGVPELFTCSRNKTHTLPFIKKFVKSIEYRDSKEDIVEAINLLVNQRSLVDGTDDILVYE